MRRVKISDLVRETGLSRATIDRALNNRDGVHPRTNALIKQALEQLEQGETTVQTDSTLLQGEIDGVFQLGQGIMSLFREARDRHHLPLILHDMHMKNEEEMLTLLEPLCQNVGRPLIIATKSTERINALLTEARQRGKRIISIVSDVKSESRDAFIGIDDRMAGQTAAFLIGGMPGRQDASVAGVILGDYAFNCHEDREIGFRSHLRAHYPTVRLADVTLSQGEDAPEQTYLAVKTLLEKHPDISAIYNVGGGNRGMAQALIEKGLEGQVVVISHEVDFNTTPLLLNGILSYTLAQDPYELLRRAVNLAVVSDKSTIDSSNRMDFGVYTRYNLPRFN